MKFPVLKFFSERLLIHLSAGGFELIHDRLEPCQIRDHFGEQIFSPRAQVNELHTGTEAASNRPHLTHGSERSSVDAHNNFGPHPAIKGQSCINAASVQTQVADRPRNKNPIGREATDLRLTAADESHAAAAIFFCAIVFCVIVVCIRALRHVYKIVCRARILENGIKVMQNHEPK